jgi:YbbR domain-containing protein
MSKQRFRHLFDNDRFLKIVAVVVAVISWLLVTTVINADTPVTLKKVPISTDLSGTTAGQNGLSIVSMSDTTTDVHITGKSYHVGLLTADDVSVSMNLSNVTQPGIYEVELNIKKTDTANSNFEILYSKPSKITVEFDRLKEETFSLEAYVPNVTVPKGYFLEQAMVTPNELTVSGPETIIDQIDRCQVSYEDSIEIESSQSVDGTLKFYDQQGNEIDSSLLSYKGTSFKITIPVYKQITVPLTFDYINVPEGIDASKLAYEMSAEEIRIGVPVDAATDVKEISLGQIDFRKIDVGSVFTFDVSLLAGYINTDSLNEVTVQFPSDGMSYVKLSSNNIVLKNVPANYNVDVITTHLADIKFVGETSVVESLTSSDVVVVVDFSNIAISEGEKRVAASIILSGGQQAWAVGEDYSVLVSIESVGSEQT